jgi:hypothetical protein
VRHEALQQLQLLASSGTDSSSQSNHQWRQDEHVVVGVQGTRLVTEAFAHSNSREAM